MNLVLVEEKQRSVFDQRIRSRDVRFWRNFKWRKRRKRILTVSCPCQDDDVLSKRILVCLYHFSFFSDTRMFLLSCLWITVKTLHKERAWHSLIAFPSQAESDGTVVLNVRRTILQSQGNRQTARLWRTMKEDLEAQIHCFIIIFLIISWLSCITSCALRLVSCVLFLAILWCEVLSSPPTFSTTISTYAEILFLISWREWTSEATFLSCLLSKDGTCKMEEVRLPLQTSLDVRMECEVEDILGWEYTPSHSFGETVKKEGKVDKKRKSHMKRHEGMRCQRWWKDRKLFDFSVTKQSPHHRRHPSRHHLDKSPSPSYTVTQTWGRRCKHTFDGRLESILEVSTSSILRRKSTRRCFARWLFLTLLCL